ncbi:uncharacterized protein RCO7_14862 [Rhynchosporium graminicola]|uniref:Uncharacterized protein n=1 Tax=Rhynchosporium graminicola TaxID=2792576 RepID=A0A1E1L6L7_9HELO|nr:uncharacterized protein RCO7_14862 [Rhynchosporium commune]
MLELKNNFQIVTDFKDREGTAIITSLLDPAFGVSDPVEVISQASINDQDNGHSSMDIPSEDDYSHKSICP